MQKLRCKAILAIMFILIMGIIASACGDNNQNNQGRFVQPQRPMFNWSMTDDGFVQYRWLQDGSCIVNFMNTQYTIPRHQNQGRFGMLGWEWEDDGDVDIWANGRKYDLDSPYDYDGGDEVYGEEYYDEDDGGGAAGVVGLMALGAGRGHLKQKKVKVYGYDQHGNPLDKKGRIVSKFDKTGKPVTFVDSKGHPLPTNSAVKNNLPDKGVIAGPYSTKTQAQITAENEKLKKQLADTQAKSDRQRAELKRQQTANAGKNKMIQNLKTGQQSVNTPATDTATASVVEKKKRKQSRRGKRRK